MIRGKVESDALARKIAGIVQRASDLTPAMNLLGRYMMASVRDNFAKGGRPETWASLRNVEVLPKGSKKKKARVQGRARMGGPLVKSGNLRRSVGYTPEARDLVLWAHPDPAVKGPVHQYGAKGKNFTIPARPYLVFQNEDQQYAHDLISGFIRTGMMTRRGA